MSRQAFGSRTTSAPKASTPASTSVRNTTVPRPQQQQQQGRAITHEAIAKRAYEISQSPQCGSEFDNWIRAERELKGGR